MNKFLVTVAVSITKVYRLLLLKYFHVDTILHEQQEFRDTRLLREVCFL
jgi:hypothetical protein